MQTCCVGSHVQGESIRQGVIGKSELALHTGVMLVLSSYIIASWNGVYPGYLSTVLDGRSV